MELSANRPHIVWLDFVRFIAMFTVVCCHCTDPFNFYPGTAPNIGEIKFWGAAYGSLVRPCVPLFVMITGALLLPITSNASSFYRKRIPRVLFPFLIWSVLYDLFPWFTGVLGLDKQIILDFFPYSGEEAMQQSLNVSIKYILSIPFNFSILAVHMWYIYVLIGLYLYLPIFSSWVEKASEHAKLMFLIAWGITLFLPYYYQYVSVYLWGTCSWNSFGMFYAFAGFNGYLLLGHYLKNLEWSLKKTCWIGIPMFIVGYFITFFGFRHNTSLENCTPEMLELFFTYCSINVLMMTIPVFMLAKKINIKSEQIRKALANLTVCGFGIYIIHYFFTGPSVILVRALNVPIYLQIPSAAIVAFFFAWLIVKLIYRMGKPAKFIVG